MAKTKEQLEYQHPQGARWITKKPVFLAGGKTFQTMQDAEKHLKNYEGVGLDIIEIRRHYMKGTDITLIVCDWRKFIELKKQQQKHGSNIRS